MFIASNLDVPSLNMWIPSEALRMPFSSASALFLVLLSPFTPFIDFGTGSESLAAAPSTSPMMSMLRMSLGEVFDPQLGQVPEPDFEPQLLHMYSITASHPCFMQCEI